MVKLSTFNSIFFNEEPEYFYADPSVPLSPAAFFDECIATRECSVMQQGEMVFTGALYSPTLFLRQISGLYNLCSIHENGLSNLNLSYRTKREVQHIFAKLGHPHTGKTDCQIIILGLVWLDSVVISPTQQLIACRRQSWICDIHFDVSSVHIHIYRNA